MRPSKRIQIGTVVCCLFWSSMEISWATEDRFTKLVQQLVDTSNSAELVFWGELHQVPEQGRSLQNFLEKSSQLGIFSAVATEMILQDDNELFRSYLLDPLASPNSEKELEFFSVIARRGYVWTKSEEGRNVYRVMRRYQLQNPHTKFCGIDALSADDTSQADRQRMWDGFSESLKEIVLNRFGGGIGELLKSQEWWIREAAMANATLNCIASEGRTLIHAGVAHVKNHKYLSLDQQREWSDLSALVSEILPKKSKVFIVNTLVPLLVDGSDDVFQDFRPFSEFAIRKGVNGYRLIDRVELVPEFTSCSDDKAAPGYKAPLLWDWYIIGPAR